MNRVRGKKGVQTRLEKQVNQDIERTFEKIQGDYKQQTMIARSEFERKQKEAESEQEVKVAEQEKKTAEDEVRAHLRGFSRTIPSFIMAYGDENLTLANFDDYTEEDVFLEVTGITEDDFRFLRDGGDYENPETGEMEHFDGHLFDEVVFNDSMEKFWKKKQQLANYFDESLEEDIFDYIPPQKTNQIFTPRWVVVKMVDELEANNPGCFDDPNKTFADLYMKSGLYITEIVKRLYRSEAIKAAYPDDKERICHILQKQVYGMAPTRIIYLIATNYILGFDEELKAEVHNFVEADAAEAAKRGGLEELEFKDKLKPIIKKYGNIIFKGDSKAKLISKSVKIRNKIDHVRANTENAMNGKQCGFYIYKFSLMYRYIMLQEIGMPVGELEPIIAQWVADFNGQYPQLRV